MDKSDNNTRPLSTIAIEVYSDWTNIYFGAVHYLKAMSTLYSIEDSYKFDSGRSVVAQFLFYAKNWKGEVAGRVKKELTAMLKTYRSMYV